MQGIIQLTARILVMARIQSTWPQRNVAIALASLCLTAISVYSYLGMPSSASTISDAPVSIRERFQAEFAAFITELKQSDEAMQEASKHRSTFVEE